MAPNYLHMKIKLIGWIVVVLLGAVIVGVLWYFLFAPKPTPQAVQKPPVTLPTSGSVTPVVTATSSSQSPQTMSIAAQNGGVVVIKDFIHDGVTLADPSNEGNYYLTGASTEGFAIGYRVSGQFFTIALEKEPLGETRIAAEEFLLSALGINKNQLCSLDYYLGTDVYTSSNYAGRNLGFSFCPGATVLPK